MLTPKERFDKIQESILSIQEKNKNLEKELEKSNTENKKMVKRIKVLEEQLDLLGGSD